MMMINKIKCFLGLHDWSFCSSRNRHGAALGNKCLRCGTWKSDAVKVAFDYPDQDILEDSENPYS